MTCRDVIEFLNDYLHGELPSEQQAEFDRHIKLCPPCVNYMSTYAETVRLGKAALGTPEGEAPPEIPEALVQAVLAARRKHSS